MSEGGRRRWGWLAVVVGLALAAAAWLTREPLRAAAGWVGSTAADGAARVMDWATRLRDMAGDLPPPPLDDQGPAGVSRSALVVVGADPGACAFALLALSPEGAATVTVVPQELLGVVPGYGEFALAEALAFEDADLAALTVVNLLGVRIDRVIALEAGLLAGVLPANVAIDLPAPFFALAGAGPVEVLPAGPQSVGGRAVERLLVEVGAADPFEWLQRQGAAWRAILGAIAADPSLADRLAVALPSAGAELTGLLVDAATAAELLIASLPVEQLEPGGEALRLAAAGPGVPPAGLGHLRLREGERPRVEVLNGNGRIGATRLVAEAVVRHGFRVVRTDNADRFDYPATRVLAQGREAVEAAREVAGIVGVGSVYLEEASPSPAAEVVIIVGLDIPAGEA